MMEKPPKKKNPKKRVLPGSTKQKVTYVHGIECPVCMERLYSRSGHDMRYCKCSYCYVDGGRNYMRVGYGTYIPGKPLLTDFINMQFGPPKTVKIAVGGINE